MNFKRDCLVIFLLFFNESIMAQDIRIDAKPLNIRLYESARIIRQNEINTLVLTSDVNMAGESSNHTYFFDDSLRLNRDYNFKLRNKFFDNSFFLQNRIFITKMYETDAKYYHDLTISKIVDRQNTVDTSIRIFEVDETKNENIVSHSPSFQKVTGTGESRCIYTYNNDYGEKGKEGFVYRMIDENGTLSNPDSVNLPYDDKICNIIRMVYDDAGNKIYLVCEMFRYTGKKERVTDHFFLAEYNMNAHALKLSERFQLGDGQNCKIKLSGKKILLAELAEWNKPSGKDSISLLEFERESLKLNSVQSFRLSEEFIRTMPVYGNTYVDKKFVPVKTEILDDHSLACLYELRFSSKEFSGTVLATSILKGVLRSGIPLRSKELVPFRSDLIFIRMDTKGGFFTQYIKRGVSVYNYDHSVAAVQGENKIGFIYNDVSTVEKESYSEVRLLSYNNESGIFKIDSVSFSDRHISFVDVNSAYQRNGTSFLIGNKLKGNTRNEKEIEKTYCILRCSFE